jgi:hypothetical protein
MARRVGQKRCYLSRVRRVKLKFLHPALFLSLCLLYLIIVTQQINLTGVDLGRHIANGRALIEGFQDSLLSVFSKNLYSYTFPEFPFVNHHWATGVVFYAIESVFGFEGLSVFYSLLSLATFLLFFHLAFLLFKWKSELNKEEGSPLLKAILVGLLVLPLISSRAEIRPEGFSAFFAGVFYWILLNRKHRKISGSILWLLPAFMIFWVNLHIYFFLGFFLIGSFLLDEIYRAWRLQKVSKEFPDYSENAQRKIMTPEVKNLSLILLASGAAALINPIGIQLAVFPFLILKDYGYTIAENQSAAFFLKRPDVRISGLSSLWILFGVLCVFLGRIILVAFTERRKPLLTQTYAQGYTEGYIPPGYKGQLAELLVTGLTSFIGFGAVRNISLSGYFALPGIAALGISAGVFRDAVKGFKQTRDLRKAASQKTWLSTAFPWICFLSLGLFLGEFWIQKWNNFGIGLMPGVSGAGEFIKKAKLEGPLFNNYDIGSYLIYYLYPETKVFVDNRPEAYPAEFFRQTYIPMQQSDSVWKTQSEKFQFNAIVFYWHDLTDWGQNFLIARSKDPDWVLIYQDSFSIIWVKRTEKNWKLITQYGEDSSSYLQQKPSHSP